VVPASGDDGAHACGFGELNLIIITTQKQFMLWGWRTAKLPVPPLPPVMSKVSAEVTFNLSCSAR
jgi:hypothetical protein